MTVTCALVRAVPDSFADCELTWIERAAPDVVLARKQHNSYVSAIRASGLEVLVLPPDEAHPDCPFVEDIVLELGHLRVLTSPGAASRRAERSVVAAAIGEHVRMPEHLRLDGGDVIRLGERVWVGESTRTRPEAIHWAASAGSILGLRALLDLSLIHI